MASRGSSAWRAEVWGDSCNLALMQVTYMQAGGPRVQVHRRFVGTVRAIGRIMRKHHYMARVGMTGGYNCRAITGGTTPSAHAYGLALDVNWDTNPYRNDKLVTDMPRAMIEEIEALQTDRGVIAVRWGGDWDGRPDTPHSNYDAMHFETMAAPEELRWGFSIPDFDPEDRWAWPMLAFNEKGPAVKKLQQMVNETGALDFPLEIDGFFGEKSQIGVATYQASRGMTADGVVGLATWTALFTHQPAGGVSPHKGQAVSVV